MNKQELLSLGKNYGIQLRDVEKIILKKTELSREQFFLLDEIELSEDKLVELKELFRKISFGYPLEYILESAEFYGLEFYVDKRCLIPRDDTEVMVDEAIKTIRDLSYPSLNNKGGEVCYIDVGTGSGAIPISIIDNIGHKIEKTYAIDISQEALEIAKKNIKKHKLVDKIELIQSDLLSHISPLPKRDAPLVGVARGWVITANLPYIKDEDYGNMDKEVILHEPSVALYGGKKTGFELYEKLIHQILDIKKINNTTTVILFIEIGFDQKEIATAFLDEISLEYKIVRDNRGVERCIKVNF